MESSLWLIQNDPLLQSQSDLCNAMLTYHQMQAALILCGCLVIKSIYMIGHNIRARHKPKDHILTFGDAIVASVIEPELKVQNECMVNTGDGYRQKVSHTCHKHCKDPIPSMTGDSIGHCQKCKKYNDINYSADLPHPSIAIKYKRSLLSNLGSTAITQMLILTFTSLFMLSISLMLVVFMAYEGQAWDKKCKGNRLDSKTGACRFSKSDFLGQVYGTWGGFSGSATLTSLPPDNLSSEFAAFAISNGPQFLYSLLYMLLVYNLSLISMEHEWGRWEIKRRRPRCTIVSGKQFEQSYFLQLPSKIVLPLMLYAALMHWLLGQAISTAETIYTDDVKGVQHSLYFVSVYLRNNGVIANGCEGHIRCIPNFHFDDSHDRDDCYVLVGVYVSEGRIHSSDVSFHIPSINFP